MEVVECFFRFTIALARLDELGFRPLIQGQLGKDGERFVERELMP